MNEENNKTETTSEEAYVAGGSGADDVSVEEKFTNTDNGLEVAEKLKKDKTAGKRVNRKVVAAFVSAIILFAVAVGVFAFLNFKTTMIVGQQVCSAEGVSKDDYYEFRLFSDGETRDSYKEELETTIRKDKASAKWNKDREAVSSMLSGSLTIADDVMKLYNYAVSVEDKSYENLNLEFNTVQFSDEFTNLLGNNADNVAKYTAMLFAEDSYYLSVSRDDLENLKSAISSAVSKSGTTKVAVYKIDVTEYDPAGISASECVTDSELQSIRDVIGDDSKYQYLARVQKTYGPVMVTIFIAADTEEYSVLSIMSVVSSDAGAYLASFTKDFGGKWTDNTYSLVTPVVVDLTAAKEYVDGFAGFLSELFRPLVNDEALDELYHFFYNEETTSEPQDSEDTDEIGETGEAETEDRKREDDTSGQKQDDGYSDLTYVSLYKEFSSRLEEEFNARNEWGIIVSLDSIRDAVSMIGDTYTDYRYLVADFETLFAEASQDDKTKVYDELITSIAVFEELRDAIRYSGDIEFVSSEIMDIDEEELQNFLSSYMKYEEIWYPNDGNNIQQMFYVTNVTYSVPMNLPEDCTTKSDDTELFHVTFKVATTDKGSRVIGINLDFNSIVEKVIPDIDTEAIVETPNYPYMMANAKANVNQEEYSTEEEYNLAMTRWLYQNYPDYYSNPDAIQVSSSQNYTASGYSQNKKSIWDSVKQGAGEIWNWATVTDTDWVWVGGRWHESLQGSLERIWSDMSHGSYGLIPDIVVNGTEWVAGTVQDAWNATKDAVSDAWNGVKDWWGSIWR